MAVRSPLSVKSREVIGGDAFSTRREVFGKHDTVFLPEAGPGSPVYAHADQGKTTGSFRRNGQYSSMREPRGAQSWDPTGFRERKYSDHAPEANGDDVEYRRSMTERTRRLSKLRKDFLTSNLHEPAESDPFARSSDRSSLRAWPASPASATYKINSPNLYKFPFAEPYSTPPPVRRVLLDLSDETDSGKENSVPIARPKPRSLSTVESPNKVNHHKFFEELVKRYSPQRKPIDWKLPPTKPKIVGSVTKASVSDSIDSADNKTSEAVVTLNELIINEVFENDEPTFSETDNAEPERRDIAQPENNVHSEARETRDAENGKAGGQANNKHENDRDSKVSLTELAEKNDRVPELSTSQRPSLEPTKRPSVEVADLTIPALLEKMATDGRDLEKLTADKRKVKRKRSFLQKLLGKKKDK